MPIAFSSNVSVPDDVMTRQVGDETVLLDLKSAKYLGLDDVSTRIWQVLTGGSSIQSAYEALVAEFDVDPEQLRKDLDDFVQELLDLGLVKLNEQ
jgi:hypothetical protein